MIKVVLFDLGGVLIPEMAIPIDTQIAEMFNIPKPKYFEMINKLKPLVRKGRLTLFDMYSEVVRVLGKDLKPKDMLQEHIKLYKNTSTKRNKEVLSLIEELKSYCKVCCITETEKEIAELNSKNGLFSYFDKAYLSVDIGFTKSEEWLYLEVIEDLCGKPNEILLIDDKDSCIVIANSCGIKGIVFKDIKQLKRELKLIFH